MKQEKGVDPRLAAIFQAGSKTYFNSSLFFSPEVRRDVFRLYGFVRVADNFVDAVPQDAEGFRAFVSLYRQAQSTGKPSGDFVIDAFLDLSRERNFPPEWTAAFLRSMEMDLTKNRYATMDEMLEYVYGSAEVIGLFMAGLLNLPKAAHPAAQMLGRAMQVINFIRDIAEDNSLGRTYLPLAGSGLPDLREETARAHPQAFENFVRGMVRQYLEWQAEAEKGYRFIPARALVSIKTASDMYKFTADRIYLEPWIVFRKKVKPSKPRIVLAMLGNFLARCNRRTEAV